MDEERDVHAAAVAAIAAVTMAGAGAGASATSPAEPTRQAYIHLPFDGGLLFKVFTDPDIVDRPGKHSAEMLHLQGKLLTMIDTYASRTDGKDGCEDGEETYIRLLDIEKQVEVSATLARSCRRKITAGDPIVTWKQDGSGFTINLTSGAPIWVSATRA